MTFLSRQKAKHQDSCPDPQGRRFVLPDPGNLRPLREGHSHRQDHLQEAVSVPNREQGHHDLDRLLVQRR